MRRILYQLIFLLIISKSFGQSKDTLFLMNGNVIGQNIYDTLLNAISIFDPKDSTKKLHYEEDQLYMVKYANGFQRYYYSQDSTKYNWFTREEMWFFMKGEADSRKGFKPKWCAVGAGIAGLIGGLSGTFWGPILPYSYMAFSGITKIRIKHHTISNPSYLQYDAYILGYERISRQKRKIWSLIGGSIGLAAGYGGYFLLHDKYPETFQVQFLRIKL